MSRHPIPEAALKESIAIIGRTGSGKTFAAKTAVERLLEELARVCIVDPTGVWWGLRSSADGKKPAFPVVVFGGDHADVPIAESSGAAIATTLADKNLPSIVDVSDFTMAGRVRFITAFLETLYMENRLPLTLVFDEADLFAPQRPGKDQLVMLGRMEQICRRGRVRGFRPWLITQRPASLHKAVLSQANTLVAMQLTAPQDRDALGDWIEGQADRAQGKKILAELPKLKKGEGFVWAPHHDVLERVKFPPISTYDSSRTPEDGQELPPVTLAAVDLSEIHESLTECAEAVDHPAELRKRIADLEARPAGATREQLQAEFERGRVAGFAALRDQLRAAFTRLDTLTSALHETLEGLQEDLDRLAKDRSNIEIKVRPAFSAPAVPRMVAESPSSSCLGKAEKRILAALAQYPQGRSKNQIAILAGYAVNGGSFNNALSSLRTKGCITRGDPAQITADGFQALGDYEPLPRGPALLEHWLNQLGKAERKALEAVANAWPGTLTKHQVAMRAGYEADGGSFNNALSKLRTLELIKGRGEIKASEAFFQ